MKFSPIIDHCRTLRAWEDPKSYVGYCNRLIEAAMASMTEEQMKQALTDQHLDLRHMQVFRDLHEEGLRRRALRAEEVSVEEEN